MLGEVYQVSSTILLIDDDLYLLKLYEVALKLVGYHVHTCSNPLQALTVVKEIEPDCILLDMNMPTEDIGLTLAKTLKTTEATKHIPIIFISAAANNRVDMLKMFDCGAVDCIAKPVNLSRVNDRIDSIVTLSKASKLTSKLLAKL